MLNEGGWMPFPHKMITFAPSGRVLDRGLGEGLSLTPRSKNNLKNPPKLFQPTGMKNFYITLLLAVALLPASAWAEALTDGSEPTADQSATPQRIYTVRQAQAMGLLPAQEPAALAGGRSQIKAYSDASAATGYGYGLTNEISFLLSYPPGAEWGDANPFNVVAGARKGTDLYLVEYTLDENNSIRLTNLHRRDLLTDSMETVAELDYESPIVVDMAYSAMTGQMYCLGSDRDTGNEALYTIDLTSGLFTKVGDDFSEHYYSIASNRGGMLFAVNSTAGLFRLNPLNGNVEAVGSNSISTSTAAYICSMDFDLSTETLYWALCDSNGYTYMVKIDPYDGSCKRMSKVGTTGVVEEVMALHISLPEYDSAAPAQVSDLVVTAGEAGALTATVTWTSPSTTVSGERLDSITSAQISVNGTLMQEITSVVPGGSNSVTLSGLSTGYARVDVVTTSGDYSSEPAEYITWVGADVPREPSNITLERTSAKYATLTWDAPTESVHGGYLKTSSLKYRIVRFDASGDSVIVAKTYKQDNCYLDSTITQTGRYYYKIQSLTADYGLSATSSTAVLGPAVETPFTCTFSDDSEFAMWTTIDNNGDGETWELYVYYGYVFNRPTDSNPADDWIMTPPLHLENDSTYYIYFLTYTGRGEWYPKHFQVTVGQSSDPSQNPVYLDYSFASTITEQSRIAFTAPADGEYYVAIHDVSDYSSISMRMSNFIMRTKHTGWLTGKVTDSGGNPIEGVEVSLTDSNISDSTATDGSYMLDFIDSGTYSIQYSKIGWEERADTITFSDDVETVNDVTLTAIPAVELAGTVVDTNGDAIVGGKVTFSGYGDDIIVKTDSTGAFTASLYEQTYDMEIEKIKYIDYESSISPTAASPTIAVTLSPKILAPSDFTVTTTQALATLTWSIPRDIFRHDEGSFTAQLGSLTGDEKYVNGAVFRTPAILKSMSWMTTSYQGPHEEMNLWIFDVTDNFKPTNTVLFNVMGVAQEDEVWNHYELPYAVECPNGFFLGVSYSYGMSSLATDSGTDEDYPFIPYTNYSTTDYTTNVWVCKDASYIKKNHLIRATGDEIGDNPQTYDYRYRVWRLAEEYLTDQNQWTLLTPSDGIADTSLSDNVSEVETGNYYYAIEAVYPDGNSDLVYSDLVTIESSGVTAAQLAANFTVAPIPASETLRVSMECDLIEIISLNGTTALTAAGTATVDVSTLAPGAYLLRASVGGRAVVKQIIIK